MLCDDLQGWHGVGIGAEFQDGEDIYTHRHTLIADSCNDRAETNTNFAK